MSDVKMEVINKFNKLLGSDVKNLSKCHELMKNLQEERCEIEKMLSLANSEAPSKVTAAIHEAEETNKDVEKVQSEFNKLKIMVDKQQEQVETITGDVQEKINKVEEMKKLSSYLKCVYRIQILSSSIDEALIEVDDNRVIADFEHLCELYAELHQTQCSHLASYLKESLHYWHNILKEKFSLQFNEAMTSIRWPILRDNNISAAPASEAVQKFQLLVKYLITVQLPPQLTPAPEVTSSLLVDSAPQSLPITLLLQPLRKRFKYHFYGSKKTNRVDKPEWYLTQVLTWIRDHERFLEQWVQPVFDEAGLEHVSAKVELIRGLVQLVIEKLHADFPQLQYDDTLFSHTIDEALGFDRELKDSFDYPNSQPSVISVITQAHVFVKWINMERKYARDKMDTMFSSGTAWLPIGSGEMDELKVTEIGDAFVLLLTTMTDRYSVLPQPGHRLQFLELQLELIDDLRVRLLQLLHSERHDPLESLLPTILNTTSYLVATLNDWSTNTHFLMLKHYRSQLALAGMEESCDSTLQQISVFDDALDLLQRLVDELSESLCEAVLMEVKARSRPYRHDKWFAMSSVVDTTLLTVLPSACPMFQVLVTKLHQLQSVLAVPLFTKAWQTIAAQLSNFLLEEVILQNKFNNGGAQQLQRDITRNLIPIFRQYTPKPESYFAALKEACSLLCTNPLPWSDTCAEVLVENLPFEVQHLSTQQIHDVIHRRIDVVPDLM